MTLGDFEITALLHGTHPFPDVEVLMKAKPGAVADRSNLFEDHIGNLVGHYCFVSITLNGFDTPAPNGDPDGSTTPGDVTK